MLLLFLLESSVDEGWRTGDPDASTVQVERILQQDNDKRVWIRSVPEPKKLGINACEFSRNLADVYLADPHARHRYHCLSEVAVIRSKRRPGHPYT